MGNNINCQCDMWFSSHVSINATWSVSYVLLRDSVLALRLEPRQRITSAELAALAARCQLYGAWWPPFSPKCTIVSNNVPRHRRQRRPVLCFLTPVLSVTSHSLMYCRWGRHCLHTWQQTHHSNSYLWYYSKPSNTNIVQKSKHL